MRKLLLTLCALFWVSSAEAAQVCVMLGASGQIETPDGVANQNAVAIIQAERDVIIQNLSTRGGGLALPGGFNGPSFIATLDMISGPNNQVGCIILVAGGNDFKRVTWPQYRDAMRGLFDWIEAQPQTIRMLVVDLAWRTDNENGVVSPVMGFNVTQFRARREAACGTREYCAFAERPPELNVETPALYSSAERERGGPLVHLNPAGQRIQANSIMAAADAAGFGWRVTTARRRAEIEPVRADATNDNAELANDNEQEEEGGGLLGRARDIGGRLDDGTYEIARTVLGMIWGER